MIEASNFNFKNLRFLFSFARYFYKDCVIAVVCIIIATYAILYIGYFLKEIAQDIELFNDKEVFLPKALVIIMLFFIASFATFGRIYFFGRLGEKLVKSVRDNLFSKIIKQDLHFFESYNSGLLVSRIINDCQVIRVVFIGVCSSVLRNSILLIGSIILMFMENSFYLLVSAAVLPFYIIPNLVLGKKIRELSILSYEKAGHIAARAEEAFNGIAILKASGYETAMSTLFMKETTAERNIISYRIIFYGLSVAIVPLALFVVVATVFSAFSHFIDFNVIKWDEITAFGYYLSTSIFALHGLNNVVSNFFSYTGASHHLRLIFELADPPVEKRSKVPIFLPNISFKDVCFAYPSQRDKTIFEGLSFDIQTGEKIALVGPSGSGKTSIFNLMLGLYQPHKGIIKISDVDITRIDIQQLRKEVALIHQEPYIFSGSIYENLTIGLEQIEEKVVMEALEMVQLKSFIDSSKQGLHTFIGQKGMRLSGGQKQRLSIARAILKDPSILLMDEITSSLDSENEYLMLEALKSFLKNKTTVTIAHRLSTIMNSDRIYVLKDGKIIQTGTHESLKHDGLYNLYTEIQTKRAV